MSLTSVVGFPLKEKETLVVRVKAKIREIRESLGVTSDVQTP